MEVETNSIVYSPPHLSYPSDAYAYINKQIFYQAEVIKALVYLPKLEPVPILRILDDDGKNVKQEAMTGTSSEGYYVALVPCDKLQVGRYAIQIVRRRQSEELLWQHSFTLLSAANYQRFCLDLFGDSGWDWAVFWDTASPAELGRVLAGIQLDALNTIVPERSHLNGRALYQVLGPLITILMTKDMQLLPFSIGYSCHPIRSLPHIDLTKVLWVLINLAPCWADVCFFYRNVKLIYGVHENELFISFVLAEPFVEAFRYDPFTFRFLNDNYPNILSELVSDLASDHLLYKMDWKAVEFSVRSFQTLAGRPF